MLKIVNTLGMINMIAAARKLNAASEAAAKTADYLQFASKFGKDPTTTSGFGARQANYETSDDYVQRCNRKAAASGDADAVHCGHNRFSDWTADEWTQFVSGYHVDESELETSAVNTNTGSGRRLNDLPKKVNHKKWMGDVKDQGACGSCAAFAATTALQGTIAKKVTQGTPVHISEQHLVDCTMDTDKTRELFGELNRYNNGCNGGNMKAHWQFMMDHGSMTIDDYPYNAQVGECAHDVDDIYAKVASYSSTGIGRDDVEGMMEVVAEQPVAAALNASSNNFRYYKSGILKSCCDKELDPDCDDTSLDINHAITIVGYRVKGDQGFWRIQNSWGSDWGNNGFIKLDLFGGDASGVCNVRRHGVFSVEVDTASIGQ